MKKHELIKHAYDNYPKGTEAISPFNGVEKFTCSGNYHFDSLGAVTDGNGWSCLYIPSTGKWAEIVTDERKPLLMSEDGVELFEGDLYYRASRKGANATGEFILFEQKQLGSCHFVCGYPETNKAFYSKETAEKWIEEQNKPKEIEVKLYYGLTATVSKKSIFISGTRFELMPSDIEDISHALKQLQS